ncbi:hypothetical protein ACWCHM_26240 [Micromonospora sp. SCSIO 07396]
MTTTYYVRGQVPQDSPLQALAGRTVTLPAAGPIEAAVRAAELATVHADPVIVPARYVPWTPIALGLTGAIVAALAATLTAASTGHDLAFWVAAGTVAALAAALVTVLVHLEMDR